MEEGRAEGPAAGGGGGRVSLETGTGCQSQDARVSRAEGVVLRLDVVRGYRGGGGVETAAAEIFVGCPGVLGYWLWRAVAG